MTFYNPTLLDTLEPNESNVRQWLTNLYSKFQPMEQARWNESQIDSMFYAGAQTYINGLLSPGINSQQYYFNLIQQPINMVTGYERQHRKGFMYQASQGGDVLATDQYTQLVTDVCNTSGVHEMKSRAKELAAVSGMVLLQPFLDYTDTDQLQGTPKMKLWEHNSFLIDPYFRNPDLSDCRFIWCQEYISRLEAEERFGDRVENIGTMGFTPQRNSNFYFLPENQNFSSNDLLIVSYVWYRWKKKKQKLYSRSRNQFFEFGLSADLEAVLYNIPDLELVEVVSPCWNLATILNDQLMYKGDNPLGDLKAPMVPYFWNYDPQLNQPSLRVRSLTRPMRDPQFLFSHKIIQNNDIAAATINAGWKRKSGAVANEDNLKKSGQGYDIVINPGFELTDCEKIIPSAVPQSDLELANQMMQLIYSVSGIQMENWAGQNDRQISALTMMMKQAANLMVFQKYFDQWDFADKMLADLILKMLLNNWNEAKVSLYLNAEPSPYFFSKIFSNYKVIVEETDLTPTQQNLQAQQMIDINQAFGREVFPASMIVPKLNITGKSEIIPYLQQQEQAIQQSQQQQQNFAMAAEDAKLKELYSKAAANIAMARERHGRAEADIGLFEERLSEITHNRAMATKAKMEALDKLVGIISQYGELDAMMNLNTIDKIEDQQTYDEDREKVDAKQTSLANNFFESIMGNNNQNQLSTSQMM